MTECHRDGCGCDRDPLPVANRPGLSRLAYRAGTHGTFLATMRDRLSTDAALAGLRTRDGGDASLALLDAWAVVADVLTFYQERIANEGYLRTATEYRSVVELVRLIGHTPRPGVAATAYLAFTLRDGGATDVPAGTRAQSRPGPGELPQTFETAEPLPARAEWNLLRPRQTAPAVFPHLGELDRIYLAGQATGLAANDLLVIVSGNQQALVRVATVTPERDQDRTRVTLTGVDLPDPKVGRELLADILTTLSAAESKVAPGLRANAIGARLAELAAIAVDDDPGTLRAAIDGTYLPAFEQERAGVTKGPLRNWLDKIVPRLAAARDALGSGRSRAARQAPPAGAPVTPYDLTASLLVPPSVPPPSPQRVGGDLAQRFAAGREGTYRLLSALEPRLAGTLLPAWASTSAGGQPPRVYALRTTARLYGNAVPTPFVPDTPQLQWTDWPVAEDESTTVLYLDGSYPAVDGTGWLVVETPQAPSPRLLAVTGATTRPRSQYGLIGVPTTVVTVAAAWWAGKQFSDIRGTVVHTGAEELPLAEQPLPDVVPDGADRRRITLDGLYGGLDAGRWLVVAGERIVSGPAGAAVGVVPAAELVMVAGAEHGADTRFPGATPRTTLVLAEPLSYDYRRRTLVIHGNVARGTHGATHVEILGSGDAAEANQRFPLTHSPLTYVASADPSGIAGTLQVRVDGVRWRRAGDPLELGPADRGYTVRTGEARDAEVVFGDGTNGRRLPTGLDNVAAEYRSGLGAAGNVAAGRISLLGTAPEDVRSVLNPLPATGGAEPDDRDTLRHNAPLTTTALDRLVSVRDYEDFARTFAGIGKARAVRGSDGRRLRVHVTVAGVDDAPLSPRGDAVVNLRRALRAYGDPGVPVQVEIRALLLVVVEATLGIDPDHRFDLVAPAVRSALLRAFGFRARDLGQDLHAAEVISTMQAVAGVAHVDLDRLGVASADPAEIAALATLGEPPSRIAVYPPDRRAGRTAPAGDERAELAILSPDVPDTILLREAP